MTENRYAETEGKMPSWIGFVNDDGSLIKYNPKAHCKSVAKITPDKEDTFTVNAVFTDSTRTERSDMRDNSLISVKYICGPAISLGGNRFRVDRDHPTWRNPRRRAIITLCAETP